MRSRILAVIILFITSVTYSIAQRWMTVDPLLITNGAQRDFIPDKFITYEIEHEALKSLLWSANDELIQPINTSNTLLKVGLADGSVDIFRVVRYSMMEQGLTAKYPDIRTFRGVSISNPYRTLRADWTANGFRAVIRDPAGMTYIDPYQRNDISHCIAYYRKDYSRTIEWTCGFDEVKKAVETPVRAFGDCLFRSYRLAVAATGEYSNHFGATSSAQSAIVLAEVVTAINRVNEVYEADFTVRLVLIANTDAVFYYNPTTDPYSTGACTQLSQNQTTLDNIIGSANYDIGHVFSVGSGGCANLNSLCLAGSKAKGATGLNPPTGDPFYIDYVAHELGHQFGGSHTFNGTAGSCNGNRSASSAYEPGSGSTIQAYAGICGAQNLQSNSDAYMHARSLVQITNLLASTSCAAFITFNNNAPVAASTPDYTIPISTPFVLTANVTDQNNDSLSYCWEQYDLEATSTEPPASNDIDGPLFRSFTATPNPSRYFPRLQDLTQNLTPTWEVLPSVTRTMNFRMTVRDYHNIAGCTDEDDVVVTANATAGPFAITSQNTSASWAEGSSQTITWNVANTTAAPVSCPNVDIRLSYDGGFTYPTLLVANETNDGSATITVPAGTTSTGRVMVKGSDNIFFDINNQNITITAGLPNYTLSINPTSVAECNDGSVQTTVTVGSFMGYTDPVTLSLINPPPGAIATYLPLVVIPGNTSTLTISNLNGLSGSYTPVVQASSTTGIQNVNFPVTLLLPSAAPVLTMPANHQENIDLRPTLIWNPAANATSYDYQVSLNNNFNPVIYNGNVATTQVLLATLLGNDTKYYWRVRGNNECGAGNWSSVYDFKTMICESYLSTDVPIAIPSGGTPTITSILNIPLNAVILDMNVIDLTGTHTFVDNLKFTLRAPNDLEVLFWDRPCDNQDNFSIHFDDEAANLNWPCPPTNAQTYKPNNAFTPFDALNFEGTWELQVQDVATQNGGSLNSWGLRVCRSSDCLLTVTLPTGDGPGTLIAAYNCAASNDTIILSSSLANQTINIGEAPLLLNKSLTIIAQSSTINITGSGERVFELRPGTNVLLSGMKITAGTSETSGAIANLGNLTLKNVVIDRNTSVTSASLVTNAGGLLKLEGNCQINQ